MHLGLTAFYGTVSDKVARRAELVLSGSGLQIRNHDSVTPASQGSKEAYRANLEAQFAKKPSVITAPKVEVLYEAPEPERYTGAHDVNVNRFFGRDDRLHVESWTHIDQAALDTAVANWANK
jgi:hypothetical protein